MRSIRCCLYYYSYVTEIKRNEDRATALEPYGSPLGNQFLGAAGVRAKRNCSHRSLLLNQLKAGPFNRTEKKIRAGPNSKFKRSYFILAYQLNLKGDMLDGEDQAKALRGFNEIFLLKTSLLLSK